MPKWNVYDIEGKPTNTRLYKSIQWENYQRLYSLKALRKDIRFSNVWTDVNGPSKFLVQCTLDLGTLFSGVVSVVTGGSEKRIEREMAGLDRVQLNEYEAAPYSIQFSQNLTYYCLLISVFFPKFT